MKVKHPFNLLANCLKGRPNSPLPFPRALAGGLALAASLLGAAPGRAQTNIEILLHSFTGSPDGAHPMGSLVLGVDSALYGITYDGGGASGGGGTIFKINRDGSGYLPLHSFALSETGDGSVGNLVIPGLAVAQGSDGTLYGTTSLGGTNGEGTVFKLNPDGSAYAVLRSFASTNAGPSRLIQGRDGALYGTGSAFVFKLNLDGSGFTSLHTFSNTPDGFSPLGKMIQASDGALYGTTFSGGTNNHGTVFKLDTDGSNYAVLHSFSGQPDGAQPYAGLLQGNDGALYGTTRAGGTNNAGSVFKLDPDGSGYTKLYSFADTPDGSEPLGSLVRGLGNVIYGTTSGGGTSSLGTVFKLNQDGSAYDVLYSFGGNPDGNTPEPDLGQGVFTGNVGVLYGTTEFGGAGGAAAAGTVFALLVNPPLSITPVSGQTPGNQTVVFWPAWALHYVLQTTTNLGSGSWATVSNVLPVTGVQLTNSLPAAYFRLIRP